MTSGYSFLRIRVQTRSRGHTATGAVCYRKGLAGTSTFNGGSGAKRTFDYTKRTGIIASGYAAPPGTDHSWSDPITWAHRIEAVDKRKNSRQCRDDVVGIPVELVESGLAEQALQTYADRLATLHGTPVHWAFHGPERGGKNYHGHFLYAGRRLSGLTFARHRDRSQDNPTEKDAPDLATVHKGIWSEICAGHGTELTWSSDAPGHHLGPRICATKRRRLVAETRNPIAETITVSKTGDEAPDERTLDGIAVIASGVNDGLAVNQMLQIELYHAQHGRPEPRAVAAPRPAQPEVLPPTVFAPRILPATLVAPEVLPPPVETPQVVPPVRGEPEVLLPVQLTPEVLPPVPEAPEVLPPTWSAPQVLPPGRRAPRVLPPTRTAPEVLAPVRKAPEIRQSDIGEPARELEQCVATIVLAAERKFRTESSSTYTAVRDHLGNRRETPFGDLAWRATEELATRARRREESEGTPPPPAAAPDKIRMVAEWLLEVARRVLEQLHLKKKRDAKSEREPRERPILPRAQSGGQEKKHGHRHNWTPTSKGSRW